MTDRTVLIASNALAMYDFLDQEEFEAVLLQRQPASPS